MTVERNLPVPPALAAFVRGNERRAWVFLWLQSGRTEAAGSALAAAIRAFAGQAARESLAQWPARFWRLVAASPLEGTGQWPDDLQALAVLAPAPRRALLLRLAAGLDEAPAAQALGVDLETYRQWLGQACQRGADGAADQAAWKHLAQAVQRAGRELPPRRLLRIADLREAALSGRGPIPGMAGPAAPVATDRRWRLALLVAVACAAALAGTWWWEPGRVPAVGGGSPAAAPPPLIRDPGPIVVEPLPAAPTAPAAAAPLAAAEPPPADPLVETLELLSWYAAGAPAPQIAPVAAAEQSVAPGAADADAATGTDDGQAPVDRHVRNAAWQQLDATSRARVHEAAMAMDALPEQEREALRQRFAALDASERRGWLLGPVLGADYASLHPLLGYVAAHEREPLLELLRAMTPDQRARLAGLARRATPQERQRLRRELLARPPALLDAWLERAEER